MHNNYDDSNRLWDNSEGEGVYGFEIYQHPAERTKIKRNQSYKKVDVCASSFIKSTQIR